MELIINILSELRNNKRAVLRLVLVLVFIGLLISAFNYTVVRVNITGDAKETTVIFVGSGDKAVTTSEKSKLVLVKRGVTQVKARSGDSEAELPFKFRSIWRGDINLVVAPQNTVQKTATSSFDCGTKGADNKIYSFKCAGFSNVLRYDTSGSFPENKIAVDRASTIYISPKPYKSGIVALHGIGGDDEDDEDYELIYTTLGSAPKSQTSTLPKSAKPSNATDLVLSTNSNNNGSFLLVNSSAAKVYYFNSLTDKDPVSIDIAEKKKDALSSYTCELDGSIVTCIYSRPSNAIDSEVSGEKVSKKPSDPTIASYKTSGEIIKRQTLKGVTRLVSFAVSSDHLFILDEQGNMDAYQYSQGGKIKKTGTIASVDEIGLLANNDLYIRRNDELWKVNQETLLSNLAFRSPNVRISSIQPLDDSLLFTGFLNNQQDNKLVQFSLKNTPISSERIEDKLPPKTGLIRELDYTADVLYIRLNLTSYTSDRVTGKFTVDPVEFAAAKEIVNKNLEESGIKNLVKEVRFTY